MRTVFVLGFVLLIAGVALIPLAGPGMLLMGIGALLLAAGCIGWAASRAASARGGSSQGR